MNQRSASLLRALPDLQIAITAEMDRVDCLVNTIQLHREGKTLSKEERNRLAHAQAEVARMRATHVFKEVLEQAGDLEPDLALDCLMVAAYPLVRPSKVHIMQRLTGQAGEFTLTQGLLHELLIPDDAHEARLVRAMAPSSPLITNGLIRAEGEGPARQFRPGFALARFITGGEGSITPPEAVRLVFEPGHSLQPLYLEKRVERRLSELVGLIGLLADGDLPMAGPAILFAGGPGTGKTLAAYHMAARLDRPLYQIDLGRMVSKWLGETERNLSRVFAELCGTSGCILLDEADALLGKRVEVKESRDQHANMTVSHLLSLLERHNGPVFLTTNLRGNLDDAYTRRLAAVVEFHQPNRALRQRIWKDTLGHLAPGLEGEALDELVELASQPSMSAAEIVNASVMAAALVREDNSTLTPADLARAIMLEKSKSEMTFARSDLGQLAAFWPEDGEL